MVRISGFPNGWEALSNEDSEFVSKEFYREADKAHPLCDERMWAIARRIDRDDFLFKMHDGRLAAIHLTWTVETTPNFPAFEIFDDLNDWKEQLKNDSNFELGS